jgi:hypothetical protein
LISTRHDEVRLFSQKLGQLKVKRNAFMIDRKKTTRVAKAVLADTTPPKSLLEIRFTKTQAIT